MSLKRGTMGQTWPLTTGNNDDPTVTQGKGITWYCNTVPDRAPGGLAYLLPMVLLTITTTLIQPATSGSPVFFDQLRPALISSINWLTSWFGTVISSDHVLGSNLPVIEYISGGYQFKGSRQRPAYPAAAGTYPIQLTVAIPAANSMLGNLLHDTTNLALLFQTSSIKVNFAAASVLGGISTGATFGAIDARMSAVLVPTTELVLGTPIENIQHQTVAGTNSPQVQINNFGTDSLMQGVQNKGGVLFLGELTSVNGQGGVFAAQNATQYTFPWRNQQQTQDIKSIISLMLDQLPSSTQNLPLTIVGGDSEFGRFPYAMNTSDNTTAAPANLDTTGLLFFPFVMPGDDCQLVDLQTANNDQSYFLTVSGGFSAGSHLIQSMYARAFTQDMANSWIGQITKGGDASLAAHVLGAKYAQGTISQRLPSARYVVTPDQMTYQPWQFTLPAGA
jgi:hypothetical protein